MALEVFLIFVTTLAVSIFVNFLNRDDKTLPWKHVIIFVISFTVLLGGGAYILTIFSNR